MAKFRFNLSQYVSGVIVPLLVLVLGFAAYFLLIPQYQQVKQARALLDSKKTATLTQNAQLSSIKSLISELQDKREAIAVVDEALPASSDIPQLLANFDHLARQSGLLISVLQLTPAPTLETLGAGQAVSQAKKTQQLLEQAENLSVIQVDATFKGRYINLKTFILNLEQNLRLMDILALTFGPVDEESGLQEYTLKIQTYHQK